MLQTLAVTPQPLQRYRCSLISHSHAHPHVCTLRKAPILCKCHSANVSYRRCVCSLSANETSSRYLFCLFHFLNNASQTTQGIGLLWHHKGQWHLSGTGTCFLSVGLPVCLIKGLSKSHTRRLAGCFGWTRGTLVKQRINHLMGNCGVLQNAIRDFLRTVSIMYNAIYKCVYQRGKLISSLTAALLEVRLNFRTSHERLLPLNITHTPTHTRMITLSPSSQEDNCNFNDFSRGNSR